MALPLVLSYPVTLNYIGGRHYTFMPTAGFLPYVKVQLWGGGGGGGHGFGNTPGGNGAGGGYVEGVFPCERGKLIEVIIGQGGQRGSFSLGGVGGHSLIGHEGGQGGGVWDNAAGGGGGGGGASVVILDCKVVAIAGGGGGGGGGTMNQAGFNAKFELNSGLKPGIQRVDQGKGWSGQNGSYYLTGGGGGGGGGIAGGGGGAASNGSPGNGGHCGSNGIYPNDPFTSGYYCDTQYTNVPGGFNVAEYPGNGIAQGGYSGIVGSTGGNGYAVITFYKDSTIYFKEGGVYRRAELEVKMDGIFKPSSIYVKDAGVWKSTATNAVVSFNQDTYKYGGWGLPYNAIYSVPDITPPGYTVWPYFDQSSGCYIDQNYGYFYPDFRRAR